MKSANITIRVSQVEKDYLIKEAEKENVNLTDYILRRIFPEKYKSIIEWEKKLSS